MGGCELVVNLNDRTTFTPVDRHKMPSPTRLYEVVIAGISDRVASGLLKPGDILPSERELAEQFQVSRVPVREALKILEFLGMLCYVPGKGMYVQKIGISFIVSKIFFALKADDKTIYELHDIRMILETYAARQAAALRTEEDLVILRDTFAADAANTSSAARSMNFHSAVICASHNEILADIYTFLSSLMQEARIKSHIEERFEGQPLAFHKQIYQCIEKQDGENAERLMRQHLQQELEFLKSSMNNEI
jgi:GntR family transcriptional repressor for pyruvate dehydrogenase complex